MPNRYDDLESEIYDLLMERMNPFDGGFGKRTETRKAVWRAVERYWDHDRSGEPIDDCSFCNEARRKL